MPIEVSANSQGNTQVSVYLMHDDMLHWPIQLISQSGSEEHYEMITPQYERAQVTNGTRTQYLINERLNFRVISIDESFKNEC